MNAPNFLVAPPAGLKNDAEGWTTTSTKGHGSATWFANSTPDGKTFQDIWVSSGEHKYEIHRGTDGSVKYAIDGKPAEARSGAVAQVMTDLCATDAQIKASGLNLAASTISLSEQTTKASAPSLPRGPSGAAFLATLRQEGYVVVTPSPGSSTGIACNTAGCVDLELVSGRPEATTVPDASKARFGIMLEARQIDEAGDRPASASQRYSAGDNVQASGARTQSGQASGNPDAKLIEVGRRFVAANHP